MSDYDWFDEAGNHDAELPHDRDPRSHPFGMFTRDASGVASVGMFFWFSSAEELAAYIREVEPQIYRLDESESEELRCAVEAPLQGLTAATDLESVPDQLNRAQDYFAIEWMGRFEELTGGDGEWAREVRAESRSDDQEMDPGRPLAPDEIPAFIEFVAAYGY